MTRRNRWLKKQARKIQRGKARRKKAALLIAKYMYEKEENKIPFPSLVEDLLRYAQGKQDVEAYKKAFGNPQPMSEEELNHIFE